MIRRWSHINNINMHSKSVDACRTTNFIHNFYLNVLIKPFIKDRFKLRRKKLRLKKHKFFFYTYIPMLYGWSTSFLFLRSAYKFNYLFKLSKYTYFSTFSFLFRKWTNRSESYVTNHSAAMVRLKYFNSLKKLQGPLLIYDVMSRETRNSNISIFLDDPRLDSESEDFFEKNIFIAQNVFTKTFGNFENYTSKYLILILDLLNSLVLTLLLSYYKILILPLRFFNNNKLNYYVFKKIKSKLRSF